MDKFINPQETEKQITLTKPQVQPSSQVYLYAKTPIKRNKQLANHLKYGLSGSSYRNQIASSKRKEPRAESGS